MPTHIGFLRAINLGAVRRFPARRIVEVCEQAGFTDVATHINTGNVRVVTPIRSRAKVEAMLESAFQADRGFAVPTIVLSPAELRQVVADAEELRRRHVAELGEPSAQYVSVLKHEPPAEVVARIETMGADGEQAHVRGRAVHLVLREPLSRSRVDSAAVERLLGVATNRNLTVMRAIAAKWA